MLSLLDTACLFELLVRLPYPDLRNILALKHYLYRLTNTPYFEEKWKKHNITMKVFKDDTNNTITQEVDSLGLKHGYARNYNYENKLHEESFYVQDKIWSSTTWSGHEMKLYIRYRKEFSYIGNDCISQTTKYDVDGTTIGKWASKNAKRHGLTWLYYDDGRIAIEEYDDGLASGRWIIFNSNGQLSLLTWFTSYTSTSYTSYNFFDNGKKWKEVRFKYGLLHGITKVWNQAGELVEQKQYENGVVVT
jgi:antitoxin component YwqK of YwqJK toxin-antitoxin module